MATSSRVASNTPRAATHYQPISRVIDTHCHVWRIDLLRRAWRAPDKIYRTLRVRDLVSSARNVPLRGIILVESGTSEEDNAWLVRAASRNEEILAFIAYADPLDGRLQDRLDNWRKAPKFRGVRLRLEGNYDSRFPTSTRFRDVLKLLRDTDLVAEFLIQPHHMRSLARALDKIQGVKAVIDHLGKPSLQHVGDSRQFALWQDGIKALAGSPSTYCKVSLSLPADELDRDPSSAQRLKNVDVVRTFLRFALTQFGHSRCCWGSDWPLSSLVGSYESVVETTHRALQPLDRKGETAVFYATAATLYSV